MFLTNKPNDGEFGTLDVYNLNEVSATGILLEFAECHECGQEYHRKPDARSYPHRCLRCGAEFVHTHVIR